MRQMCKRFRKMLSAALCLVMVLSLCGCKDKEVMPALFVEINTPTPSPSPEPTPTPRPHVTPTPNPTLENEPAPLYSAVETDKKVVALVFEGYTDADTMDRVLGVLTELDVKPMFFVSGIMATEQPEMVQSLAAHGYKLGNYAIAAAKKMENNTVLQNVHQFEKTQALITEVSGQTPTLACANGSEYTVPLLQAVAAAGLEGAVEPNAYINHKSFTTYQDAGNFVSNTVRGSIISVKLGQELDLKEFGDEAQELDEKPAVDPSPSIEDDKLATEDYKYEGVVDNVRWLIENLKAQDYVIVTPERLKKYEKSLLGEAIPLSKQAAAVSEFSNYTLPVTDAPLESVKTEEGKYADLRGCVFVGDSVTQGLQSYVKWKQTTSPGYMSDTYFLTAANASVEKLASTMTFTSIKDEEGKTKVSIEEAIAELSPRSVYLMLRCDNLRAYSDEKFLINYRLLIYRIREANPGVQVVVQSIPPVSASRMGTPTNMQIFRLNLMLFKMCAQYGIPYIDVAYAVRNNVGALREDYCLDEATMGMHLSDAGCEAWIEYLINHIP